MYRANCNGFNAHLDFPGPLYFHHFANIIKLAINNGQTGWGKSNRVFGYQGSSKGELIQRRSATGLRSIASESLFKYA